MNFLKEFLGLLYYTSELDQFLAHLDKEYPKPSASQRAESEKYDRIFTLRDNPIPPEKKETFWESF